MQFHLNTCDYICNMLFIILLLCSYYRFDSSECAVHTVGIVNVQYIL